MKRHFDADKMLKHLQNRFAKTKWQYFNINDCLMLTSKEVLNEMRAKNWIRRRKGMNCDLVELVYFENSF
jgi:hypothetical protein